MEPTFPLTIASPGAVFTSGGTTITIEPWSATVEVPWTSTSLVIGCIQLSDSPVHMENPISVGFLQIDISGYDPFTPEVFFMVRNDEVSRTGGPPNSLWLYGIQFDGFPFQRDETGPSEGMLEFYLPSALDVAGSSNNLTLNIVNSKAPDPFVAVGHP